MSSPFSDRAVRLAIHDSMLQEDQRTHARLAKEMLVIQRRIAATADLIAIEEMGRAA